MYSTSCLCSVDNFGSTSHNLAINLHPTMYRATLTHMCAAVSQIRSRAGLQLVHIEVSTVSDLYFISPIATKAAMVITNCPRHFAIGNCWVISIQPARIICIAAILRRAALRQSDTSSASEAVPRDSQT